MREGNEISNAVHRTLTQYFSDLDGQKANAVYDMVIASTEKPLLEFILRHTSGNQSAAAEILGINRNTLRRKLTNYNLL